MQLHDSEAMASAVTAGAAAPWLSIVIVTWNRWDDTRRCLDSIAASTIADFEIVVVDNGSSDGTVSHLAERYPAVRVFANGTNAGHPRAVNQGIVAALGKHVLVLDADTEVAPDALEIMLRFLEAQPDMAMVAPRTFNTDGSVQLTARSFPRPLNGLFGRQSLLTRWFPGNPLSRSYLQSDSVGRQEPFVVEQISSACMLFPRALYGAVGAWDEGYSGYWVDSDWCFKVGKAGYRIYCVPTAEIIHHEQNHADKRRSVRRIWMFHQGAYRFYRNNMTFGTLDPRAIFALLALTLHGLWQVAERRR